MLFARAGGGHRSSTWNIAGSGSGKVGGELVKAATHENRRRSGRRGREGGKRRYRVCVVRTCSHGVSAVDNRARSSGRASRIRHGGARSAGCGGFDVPSFRCLEGDGLEVFHQHRSEQGVLIRWWIRKDSDHACIGAVYNAQRAALNYKTLRPVMHYHIG